MMSRRGSTADRRGAHTGLLLRLFGGPILIRDGSPIKLSPFQSGLVAVAYGLPATETPRSTVQEHLWGDANTKAVRHRLSQLVYQTNHRSGATIVSLDGELVRAHPDVVATDLQEFERLIDAENFKAAAELMDSGFLSALPKKFVASCADWIRGQQAAHQAKLETAAQASWKNAELTRNGIVAEEAVGTLLKLSPDEEEALRRAMHARALYGSVREAESVYRAFAERALEEEGWVPQPETRALLKALRNVYGESGSLASVPYTRLGRKIPFLGRATERAALTRRMLQTPDVRPWGTITVRGAAGVGKTRFLEEVLEGLSSRQVRVIRIRPEELAADIPLSSLAQGLKAPWVLPFLRELHNPWRSVMVSLLPQFAEDTHMPRRVRLPDGHAARYAGDAFLHLFATMAKTEPVLLVVDDFHYVDNESAMVLQYLHRRWSQGYFNLVVAYRPEELVRNGRLSRFTEELKRGPDAESIRLGELSADDAANLARSVSPITLGDRWVRRMSQLAGGNPLFVVELATQPEKLPAPDEWGVPIPLSVEHIVARHLTGLDDVARQVLYGLAVLRDEASAAELAQILEATTEQCIGALERLEASSLISWAGDRARLRHGLVRQALYRTLSPGRRSSLHRSVADLLVTRSDNALLAAASVHYHRAGDSDRAQVFATQALERVPRDGVANRLPVLAAAYQVTEARARAQTGVRLAWACYRSRRLSGVLRVARGITSQGGELSPVHAIQLGLAVTDARHLLGLDGTEAVLADLTRLLEEAEQLGERWLGPTVRDTILQVLHRSADHEAMADFLAEIGAGSECQDDVARCRTEASLAMKTACGDPTGGLAHAKRAVEIAMRARLKEEVMYALHRHAVALIAVGRLATPEGQELQAKITAAARSVEDPASYVQLLLDLVEWHTNTGSLEPAAQMLSEARAVAEHMDCPVVRSMERMAQAALALAEGDPQEAWSAIEAVGARDGIVGDAAVAEAGTTGKPTGRAMPTVSPNLRARHTSILGNCLLELGKLGQAKRLARRSPPDKAPGGASVDLVLFHARLRSRTGDGDGALKMLEDGALATREADPVAWLRLTLEQVRLGRRSGVPLPDLADEAHGLALSLELPGLAHEFVPFQEG
ncbi:MAG: AAA family ATPase [Gemmatimonadetes bacterium]|nr:AAA family ATPase [Gemmatimonadota bacterium]